MMTLKIALVQCIIISKLWFILFYPCPADEVGSSGFNDDQGQHSMLERGYIVNAKLFPSLP